MMGSICSNNTAPASASAPAPAPATIKPFARSWESYIGEQQLGRPEIMEQKPQLKVASVERVDDVIRDLEQRQYPVVKEALQSTDSINNTADKLMGFMTSGADEFKQRTGRNMTYAEMRAAWG